MIKDVNYIPILKTKEAELKAFYFLDEVIKGKILPLFELTRSRRSKNNPDGDINIKLKSLRNSLGISKRYILDISSDPALGNQQIVQMLNPNNGFENWVEFINSIEDEVIPCIHYVGELDRNFTSQINSLYRKNNIACFRVTNFSDEGEEVTKYVLQETKGRELILVLDASFIKQSDYNEKIKEVESFYNNIKQLLNSSIYLVTTSSSVPKSIATVGKKTINHGNIELLEYRFYKDLNKNLNQKIIYSDYASVFPLYDEEFIGKWVPRIDIFHQENIFYYRFPILEGGYIAAAKKVVSDPNYSRLQQFELWADNEISSAFTGTPNGKSPAHWISVRINMYITKRLLNLTT